MSYTAESNTSAIEDFENDLVREFIRTATFAIFGCNPETRGKIAANTDEIVEGTRLELLDSLLPVVESNQTLTFLFLLVRCKLFLR